MKIKIFIRLILLAILPTLFLANGKHVAALVPVDDGSGAVSTSAPVPNGVKWQPNNNPSNYNPGSGAFSGSQQAFLDIGNDADYSHSANVMKIYVHPFLMGLLLNGIPDGGR